MSPVIVLDDKDAVRFVSGASGGPRITTSTAMVCNNLYVTIFMFQNETENCVLIFKSLRKMI